MCTMRIYTLLDKVFKIQMNYYTHDTLYKGYYGTNILYYIMILVYEYETK